MKNLKKYTITASLLIFAIIKTNAQSVGGSWGNGYDIMVTNNDSSDHFGVVRMQTFNRGYNFINYVNRLALSVANGRDWGQLGTELFSIRDNGYVGLGGVTNPNGELQFKNSGTNRKIILFEDGNNDHQFYGFGINGWTLRYQSSYDHVFYSAINNSSSRETFRINRDGRVGIGVTNPEQNLHVKDNAIIYNTFVGNIGHGYDWAGIAHKDKAGHSSYSIITNKDASVTLINKENTGNGFIGFRVGNSDKAVLLNNGNMGLGNTAPNGELQFANNTKNKKIVLWEDANNDHQFYGFGINNGMVRYQSGADHVFYSAINGTSSKEILRVFKDGGIKTDKVVLNIGTFPDYVFHKDYQLMPIEEVAKYIATYQHLPNIPSEKEMIATGLDVAKMNNTLVEKIEELTLYTIEQNNKIKAQENLIEQLTKRLEKLEKNSK